MDASVIPAARFLPPGTFSGDVAAVTGGGTGLGLEIARGLAALGAEVFVLSRDPAHHAGIRAEAERRGWRVHSVAVDVREPDRVRAAKDLVLERAGRIDVLVNNAAGNFVCPAERLSANAWRAVLGIALDGTFYCSREFGRAMIAAGAGGRMLNVVATYAWTGMPGVAHSASAKAGVLALTKTLAAEWARYGIRVNAIAPGPFHSQGARQNLWPEEELEERVREHVPLGRLATADEIAAQCLHVLAPASEWMTGACLVVDGGSSLARGFWNPGVRTAERRPPPGERA